MIANAMDFQLFSADRAKDIEPYLRKINTLSYEYQLSYFLLWRNIEDIHITIEDDALFVQQRASGTYLLPLADDIASALEKLLAWCDERGEKPVFASIPKEYADIFSSDRFTVEDDRALYDYIYTRERLAKLPGKHLQAKRNHVSQFMRNYPHYTVLPLTKDMKDECIEMDVRWSEKHGLFSREVTEERLAIEKAFSYFDELNLCGLALRVQDELVAFTIGEIVNEGREAIVHFEKGDISYIGVYAFICKMFVSQYFSQVEYVNRQEDMGLEGLRKSKLSYYPVRFQEKVRVWLK